jgi:hypothetical protein
MKKVLWFVLLSVLSVSFSPLSYAGAPLTNLEGVGGIAFNPLAYPADSDGDNSHLKIGDTDVVGKPRFGAWYVNLSDVNVDWTSIGVANTFYKRLEVSYGYESINQTDSTAKHKHNIGTKLLVLPENSFNSNWVPAVSVGGILKNTAGNGPDVDESGSDYYVVGTKLITQLPKPVLLSGGLLSTDSKVTGVFGYDKNRDTTLFGNVDVILTDQFIVGFEYKQGAKFKDWKDADYWDAHVAWTPNKDLTVVLAYVNAGSAHSASKVGLGDGVVLSAQYAF